MLGIGGKAEKLVHLERTVRDGVALLRRFSGGGTVIVDQDSLFATFIMNTVGGWAVLVVGGIGSRKHAVLHGPLTPCHTQAETTPDEPYPRPIMQWTATVYGPVFQRVAAAGTEVRGRVCEGHDGDG